MNKDELRKLVLKERLTMLKNRTWPYKNTCLNIECNKWTEDDCTCDGSLGCCD